ncbi:Lanthionine synthetase C-like protein [Streptomyces sp. 2224.1]|uniref:lanthionine synthetase C family protein n=1 Tax=Streptomyces sp. 2224.1 TaxID=1881020 RepID=UPI000894387F|nr:lanthionine synthetase C family protein [Streptomyces sp. 2224.1]SED90274.1 Lanthionine synthetase C-like protein [Streptomyces sp. 2224.1]
MTGTPHGLCDTASAVARRVAGLLSTPEQVAGAARDACAALPPPLRQSGWQPASLLTGHPGIALLHTRCARDDDRYAALGHSHLAAAVAAATEAGPAAVGDLLLPARLHANAHGGYTRLLARCAEVHAAYVRARVAQLVARRREHGPGLAYGDYDAIAGLAGEGRSLLLAADHGDERCVPALDDVLQFLVGISHPVRLDGPGHPGHPGRPGHPRRSGHPVEEDGIQVPGWWCAPDRYLVPRDRQEFPRGDFNVGVAHGICGPLALLSLAHRSGHRVPGIPDAIRRMADWVRSIGYTDGHGMQWPGRVAFPGRPGEPSRRRSSAQAGARSREGWCYGTSGIAWSLHLAGQALGDHRMTALAEEAIGALALRGHDGPASDDPGLCHGRAGVLHTTVRMAAATGRPALWAAADALARELIANFDERTPFGYTQVLPPAPSQSASSQSAAHRVHHPGLLDGATGIALVLADYADARRGAAPAERNGWDAALLMG